MNDEPNHKILMVAADFLSGTTNFLWELRHFKLYSASSLPLSILPPSEGNFNLVWIYIQKIASFGLFI